MAVSGKENVNLVKTNVLIKLKQFKSYKQENNIKYSSSNTNKTKLS